MALLESLTFEPLASALRRLNSERSDLSTGSQTGKRKRGSEEPERPWSPERGPYLTITETANYLAVTPRQVLRLTYEYGLPRRKIGGRYRYHIDDLNEWIEQRQTDPSAT
jgi:excisionase family DNA binding protein